MTYIRQMPTHAASDDTRCNGTDFVTEERCLYEATTFITGGGQFCVYCSPPITPDIYAAIEALRNEGMI